MRKFFRTQRDTIRVNITATELSARYRAWSANFDDIIQHELNAVYSLAIERLNTCGRTGGAGAGLAAEAGLADAEPVGPRGGDEPEAAVGHPDRI